jgi:hypothetical protein
METPSDKLASKILERLAAEKLLRPDDQRKLLAKFAAGQLSAEDWRLAVELSEGRGKQK